MTQKEIEDILRRAALVYVPGGNTFLLNHRLHVSGIMPYLRKKVQAGLPFVGFSAGMILWSILPRIDHFVAPGPQLLPAKHPRLFKEIGPRFATRPGGYTRILKLGHRAGDGADIARIELLAE